MGGKVAVSCVVMNKGGIAATEGLLLLRRRRLGLSLRLKLSSSSISSPFYHHHHHHHHHINTSSISNRATAVVVGGSMDKKTISGSVDTFTLTHHPLSLNNRIPMSLLSLRAHSSFTHHHVNPSASIDSPLISSMHSKIKEQLKAESVTVKDAYGDGRHVSIDVISSVFEGESAVSRQRMVYKAIWEELQNTVHAVDQMTTKTPSEAAATNK